MPPLLLLAITAAIVAAIAFGMPTILGLIFINERQVGIVVKRFGSKKLPPNRLVALDGESGYQADTLAPGLYFGYWRWQYTIHKVPVTVIPQGEIGLVLANDGNPLSPERILGGSVDCDDFQDARKFLLNGGEKGRQLAILTAGTYRINTALFSVITRQNASQNDMDPRDLLVYNVSGDMVGIVTTLDGKPIEDGEIAGPVIPNHDNFQKSQVFLDNGGRRGLQEQVLLSGTWNLNPWFVRVEQVPMTEIPIGHVGVVISFVGLASEDVTGLTFKHGDLVNPGHKGVWVAPLYPGKHPLNTRVMKVELVPTINIVLNWAKRTESHSYDSNLDSILVTSNDGFTFRLDVAQIIHVGALDAPKVISRVGSVQNLVDHTLEPIVSNYMRNAAQEYTVLDFLTNRQERQAEAAAHVMKALTAYDVQAIDTLIGEIEPPPELMITLTDRKIAEEQRKTFIVQQEAQQKRQQLVRETALADIQNEMVDAEQGVSIADLHAQAEVQAAAGESEAMKLRASGEAATIRETGEARAEAYRAGVEALGEQGYTALQMMQIVGDRKVRIIPDIVVGGENSSGGLVEGLLGLLLSDQLKERAEEEERHDEQPNGSVHTTSE
ncbi:MAG: flotillin family protein [Chloroflexi bacterium]|nr:flotillin family protein [Chloroflexota bacterium]